MKVTWNDQPQPGRFSFVRSVDNEKTDTERYIMGMPSPLNLILWKGEDFYQAIYLRDPLGLIDTTGWVPTAIVKDLEGATVLNLTVSVVSQSFFELKLPATSQTPLRLTRYVWQLQATTPSGVIVPFAGDFLVRGLR